MGISLSDYNEMTPAELNICIYAYTEKLQNDSENNLIQAYLTSYWHRVKRMPNLKEVLKDTKPKKRQTDAQLLAQIKAMNAAMGGKIREGG